MIRWVCATLLTLIVGHTNAETFPAFYDVSGVAADDVLNVRIAPSSKGDLIGVLAPDQTDVEVVGVSEDGRWARVNIEESSGWASMQFLTLSQDYPFLPLAHLNCYGTEPFWSLDRPRLDQPATLSILGQTFETWRQIQAARSNNRTDRFSVVANNENDIMVLTLTRGLCSDGMSDQLFGIQAEVIRPASEDAAHLSGCCALQPN